MDKDFLKKYPNLFTRGHFATLECISDIVYMVDFNGILMKNTETPLRSSKSDESIIGKYYSITMNCDPFLELNKESLSFEIIISEEEYLMELLKNG